MMSEDAERAGLIKRLRVCGSRIADDMSGAPIGDIRKVVEACEAQARIYADVGLVDEAAGK